MIRVCAVGLQAKHQQITEIQFSERKSLLDYDVVIFDPTSIHLLWKDSKKWDDGTLRLYSKMNLDTLISLMTFRRQEVESLLEAGKIIIILLSPVRTVMAEVRDKGNYVPITNYSWLPGKINGIEEWLIGGEGNSIHLINQNHVLAPMYKALKENLCYQAYLTDELDNADDLVFLVNPTNNPVGVFIRIGNGYVILFPQFKTLPDSGKLLGAITQIATSILTKEQKSIEPDWVKEFEVPGVDKLNIAIKVCEQRIEEISKERDGIYKECMKVLNVRALLFEQGSQLESAVIEGLRKLGFSAKNFKKLDMEHDIVLECKEGRVIAEVEGRDNDSIHIGKLDQLNRVLDEDFNENGSYSEGILIGNGFRLSRPENRKCQFTDKVKIAAKRKNLGLLTTNELYKAVVKVLENPMDDAFKEECRKRIIKNKGEEIVLV